MCHFLLYLAEVILEGGQPRRAYIGTFRRAYHVKYHDKLDFILSVIKACDFNHHIIFPNYQTRRLFHLCTD